MNMPPPTVCTRIRALHLLLDSKEGKDEKRTELLKMLSEHGLTWNDLPELFAAMNITTTTPLPPPDSKNWKKICERLCQLHAAMGSLDKDGPIAHKKLIERLASHNFTWSDDLPAILVAKWIHDHPVNNSAATSQASTAGPAVNVLDLSLAVIEDRVVMPSEERMVVALWTLHTHVYDQFEYTPRLGLVGPFSGLGKSTLLKVLKRLVNDPWYSHNITAPVIYRQLYRRPCTTFLLDEGENQKLLSDPVLRAVIDCTYESDGSVDRIVDGEAQKFPAFCPLAYAARGSIRDVPLAILSRSFTINMKRGTAKYRFRKNDPDLFVAHGEIQKWAATCSLNHDPDIPAELCRDPRVADNCRPLLAIAEDLGHGVEARAALIKLCAAMPNQDPAVQVLNDSLTVLTSLRVDRISKKALLEALPELAESFWDCWRGLNDHGQPHRLTSGELATLLRRVGVRTRTVWPLGPRSSDVQSAPGYYRSQFDEALRTYGQEMDTSTQPRKFIALMKS